MSNRCMDPTNLKTAILQARQLRFDYAEKTLLANSSFDVPPGVSLVRGGDGRGKTTLMRLLAGVLPAPHGELHINGTSLQAQPEAYRQQVFWAEPRSEAFDNAPATAYFEGVRARYAGFDSALLAHLSGGLSLADHVTKPLYMLSTGSKRKVWLAAALAAGAPVTLLDEPFAALDAASIAFVLEHLKGAASHRTRAWVLADYAAPTGVPLAGVVELGD